MAVPKKKTSKSRRNSRKSGWKKKTIKQLVSRTSFFKKKAQSIQITETQGLDLSAFNNPITGSDKS